jgi:hypothetical protein
MRAWKTLAALFESNRIGCSLRPSHRRSAIQALWQPPVSRYNSGDYLNSYRVHGFGGLLAPLAADRTRFIGNPV